MPEYNFNFDWNRISTLGKVKVLVEQVVGAPSQEAITQAVEDYIEAHPGSLSPLSPAVKAALLQIAEKVAYVDENGEDYYNALDSALSAKALLQIAAVYTQSGTVYTTDTLDSLKSDLVVTAYYDDGTSADVTSAAVLSGTLTKGTSTITATYSGKTATFNVTVSVLYQYVEYIKATGTQYIKTDLVVGNYNGSQSNSPNHYRFEMDFVRDAWQSNYATNLLFAAGSSGGCWIGYVNGKTAIGMGTSAGMYFSDGDLTRHSYVYTATTTTGTFERDDGVKINRTFSSGGNANVTLFYWRVAEGTQNDFHFNGKLYSFSAYLDGTLVMDLKPCYRTTDNEIGMYDEVNDRFYTNDGTGTFIKGDDI